jgi:hypothetical protein
MLVAWQETQKSVFLGYHVLFESAYLERLPRGESFKNLMEGLVWQRLTDEGNNATVGIFAAIVQTGL